MSIPKYSWAHYLIDSITVWVSTAEMWSCQTHGEHGVRTVSCPHHRQLVLRKREQGQLTLLSLGHTNFKAVGSTLPSLRVYAHCGETLQLVTACHWKHREVGQVEDEKCGITEGKKSVNGRCCLEEGNSVPRGKFFGGEVVCRELSTALFIAPLSQPILENSTHRCCQV